MNSGVKNILNVAEKPSVAKEISRILSKGSSSNAVSDSKYNPVFQFDYLFNNKTPSVMYFTSVTGHIMEMHFDPKLQNWHAQDPSILLMESTPIFRNVAQEKKQLQTNIQRYARMCDTVILWLDCDREGEAIAFQVVQICQKVNRNIIKLRAHFSAVTNAEIDRAMQTLTPPDQFLSEAVQARQEIDLRIGAAFTRFQTINLQKRYSVLDKQVIRINQFGETQFTNLNWSRGHVFDQITASVLYANCIYDSEMRINVQGEVVFADRKPSKRWKPLPLATIPLQKLGTSKLRMDAHKIMQVAEKLYNKGYISYPRTETDKFPPSLNLKSFVEAQKDSSQFGEYAQKLINGGKFENPRGGGHDDKAHPPIHPVQKLQKNQCSEEEWKVYDLITRHYLACCSMDAVGMDSNIQIRIRDETFNCKGVAIQERNFLEIYPFLQWNESSIPRLVVGTIVNPEEMKLESGSTQPPSLLTEKDLIDLMDKNGIGTDATIHEHIQTIQDRGYATKTQGKFKPTDLGVALVQGYDLLGFTLAQPVLRAKMENLMTRIAQRELQRSDVVKQILQEMVDIYQNLDSEKLRFVNKFGEFLPRGQMVPEAADNVELIGRCGKCGDTTALQTILENRFLCCQSCDLKLPVPKNGEINLVEDDVCLNANCGFSIFEIKTEKSSYNICPWCINYSPISEIDQLFCFKCPNIECQYSKDQTLYQCPLCHAGDVSIRHSKKNNNMFLGCDKYPNCTWSQYMTPIMQKEIYTSQKCQSCLKQRGITSLQIQIEFDQSQQLPSKIRDVLLISDYQASFCLYPECDKNLIDLIFWKPLSSFTNNQVTAPPIASNRTNFAFHMSNNNGESVNVNGNGNRNISNNIGFNQSTTDNRARNFSNPPAVNNFASNTSRPNIPNGNFSNNNISSFSNGDGGQNQFLQDIQCYSCNQMGHYSKNCPNGGQRSRNLTVDKQEEQKKNFNQKGDFSNLTCYSCKQPGHIAPQCPNQGEGAVSSANLPRLQGLENNINQSNQIKQKQYKPCAHCGQQKHSKADNCPGKPVYKNKNGGNQNMEIEDDYGEMD